MSTTFMTSPKLMFTSESVTEGHPDKICDQVSDAVLDACFEQDPMSRVACETATKTGFIMVLGEITTHAFVNFDELVRKVVKEIGYDSSEKGFDGNTCSVLAAIASQSPDIALGVDQALEVKSGEMTDADIEKVGAGDQGMMFGFACNETDVLMPMPIYLAHNLSRRLATLRKNGELPWLRPDGKTQVTVEYSRGRPKRVDTVLISTQHSPDIGQSEIREAVIECVINPIIPPELHDGQMRIFVNPTGRFVVGGPMGDAGVTGRKIIVDAGLAERCEIQVAYAIGVARPLSINVETFGTGKIPDEAIVQLIHDQFDLRPGAIIRDLNLRRPIYRKTAAYGHFGRTDIDAPWENTDKAADLREAADLPSPK